MNSTNTALALHGGTPVRGEDKQWPAWPLYDDAERNALLGVLESGSWLFGETVKAFEREYADFQGVKYCISCNSGTAAAELILQALGIGPGDEVLVPPYTFIATASAVLRVGATPIFVDLNDRWCMDHNLVEAAITSKTKAIMPVHFGGLIGDMDAFNSIAERHGLMLIEDACHCWGGRWQGAGAGGVGHCGFFSFQASKNITAGEGGAMVTNDDDLAEKFRSLMNCGRGPAGSPWYHHVNVGTNARLSEFQAAILRCQTTRLEEQLFTRARNASILDQHLSEIPGLTPQPNSNRNTRRAYHLYCFQIDAEQFGCSREAFVRAANAEGWPVTAGYPMPLYKQPVFENWKGYDYSGCVCPMTENLCYNSGLWFAHQLLLGTEQDMMDIVAICQKLKANADKIDV